jgi:hypothetical protein
MTARAVLALAAALAFAGCGEERAEPAASAPPELAAAETPPAMLRASVVLEPPRIEIGDRFSVEVAVVTPPGHRVAPAAVPKAVEGLWILEAERPSVEQQPGRWVHRQRFRARARATGPFTWPALELDVEAPDGTRQVVSAPERPFEVVSLLVEHPEQRSFFSYRRPRLGGEAVGSPWLPALLGALFTLAGVGLFALVRRARSGAPFAAEGPAALEADGGEAALLAALGHAEAEASDAVAAADLASAALRSWAARRFRAPALRWATTEELSASAPPFLLATRWAALLAVLRELDALRFPPLRPGAGARAREAIAQASAFVTGTRRSAP